MKSFLIFLVAISFILYIVSAQEDSTTETKTPNLLVFKNVPEYEAIVNKNLTFSITIYNIGKAAAHDVEVVDNDWPEEHFTLEGKNTAKFETIEAGNNVTFQYTIIPKNLGELKTTSAKVSFKESSAADAKVKVVRSTELPTIPVLTQSQYDKKHDTHFDEWAIFFVLLALPIGAPYLVYQYSKNQVERLKSE